MTITLGECDCCAAPNRVLRHLVAYGINTAACAPCRGGELVDDLDDLKAEYKRLRAVAVTAQDWAQVIAVQGAMFEVTIHA